MNVKRLIFASLILVALLFACQPPGGPEVGGGGVDDPTAEPNPEITPVPTASPGPDEIYTITVYAEADGEILENATYISPLKAAYATGDYVRIGIYQKDGYTFTNWEGDFPEGKDTEVYFFITVADSDITIVAHFEADGEPTPEEVTPTPEIPTEVLIGYNQNFVQGEDSNERTIAGPPIAINFSLHNGTSISNEIVQVLNKDIKDFSLELSQYYFIEVPEITGWDIIISFTNSAAIPLVVPQTGGYIVNFTNDKTYTGITMDVKIRRNSEPNYTIEYWANNKAITIPSIGNPEAHCTITPNTGDVLFFENTTHVSVTIIPDTGYSISSVSLMDKYVPSNAPIVLTPNTGTDNIYDFEVNKEYYLVVNF
ncbi:MAG: hypothetical protein JXR70_16285 [Spirochaetales bacterium]|nr:hypothetical protein [Spirochaetales bacterium]